MPGVDVQERRMVSSEARQFARDPGPGNPRVPVAGGSPEAQAYQRQGFGMKASPPQAAVQAPQTRLGMASRVAGRAAGRAVVGASRVLPPVAAAIGTLAEGTKVYDTAAAPGSTGLDIGQQVAEGAGRMASAGLGAQAGAAVGAFGGPAAPITVPLGAAVGGALGYFGAGKLMEKGREMLGSDPRSAYDRLKDGADTPLTAPTPAAQQAALPATGAGAGRGSPADPNRTDVDPTNPIFGAARDFSRDLGSVPQSMPADMRDGVILKTMDANGRPVYSGRNVGADAQMVDGMGRGFNGGGTVSTVPGMAPGEARAILDRPFDPRNAMTPAQRAQYDAEVASAQATNRFTASQGGGRGTSIGAYLRAGMQRRAEDSAKQQSSIDAAQAQTGLGMRRQAESEANSALTRQQTQLGIQSTQQIQAAQAEYLAADTAEKRAAAGKKLQALLGKAETQNRFTVIPGGSDIDPATGMVVQRPGMVLDNSTGQLVDLAGQPGSPQQTGAGQATAYPEGTRLQGPGGKIYVVRDGKPVQE